MSWSILIIPPCTSLSLTFTCWSIIGPFAISAFLHNGSHQSVTSEAAVSYLYAMFDHITSVSESFLLISVIWAARKPATSYEKGRYLINPIQWGRGGGGGEGMGGRLPWLPGKLQIA